MRILYLCHRFPYPPKRGGKIRPFNMIRHLARSHEVVVCSLARSAQEAEEGRGIAPYCSEFHIHEVDETLQRLRMVATLPTHVTASTSYFHSPALQKTTWRLLAERRFDLVFVHCSSVAHYVRNVRDVPRILDFGDMDSQKWLEYARFKPAPLKFGYAWEGHRLAAYERRLAREFDLCTATTHAEWQTLESYRTGVATDWFPNGVDSEYFSMAEGDHDADTIAFVGRMDYYPNQEAMIRFCRDVLPALQQRRPGLKLLIIGADPSTTIRKLGQIEGVTVTGSVPDVRPLVRRAALTVAPLSIARGTQNKVLESMAMGVPVVASRAAAGGVDAVPGEHLLVADTVSEQCDAIVSLLADPDRRSFFARAGRARVLSNHAWPQSMQRLDRIIERCLANFAIPSTSQTATS